MLHLVTQSRISSSSSSNSKTDRFGKERSDSVSGEGSGTITLSGSMTRQASTFSFIPERNILLMQPFSRTRLSKTSLFLTLPHISPTQAGWSRTKSSRCVTSYRTCTLVRRATSCTSSGQSRVSSVRGSSESYRRSLLGLCGSSVSRRTGRRSCNSALSGRGKNVLIGCVRLWYIGYYVCIVSRSRARSD